MKQITFTMDEADAFDLLHLISGNSAYQELSEQMAIQFKEQS